MTPREFKAWFDGFTEAFSGTPTKAQWARIKERVGEIDGRETTERIYVDRYINRYFQAYPYWTSTCGNLSGLGATSMNAATQYQNALQGHGSSFSGTSAMAALGRAEAQSLTQ